MLLEVTRASHGFCLPSYEHLYPVTLFVSKFHPYIKVISCLKSRMISIDNVF
jgi:hypothetical protein